MEDGEIVSFRQTYLLLLFYEPIDHSFPYLRTVVSPPSLYDIVSLTVTQAQQALDFHFYTDSCKDYSILQIVNFRRENLSRGACSGIVNRNIDNYGYNVSRIIN